MKLVFTGPAFRQREITERLLEIEVEQQFIRLMVYQFMDKYYEPTEESLELSAEFIAVSVGR